MFSIVIERLNSKESLKIIHNIYWVTTQLLSINNNYLGGWEVIQPAFYVSCVHPRHQTSASYTNMLEHINEGGNTVIVIKITAIQAMVQTGKYSNTMQFQLLLISKAPDRTWCCIWGCDDLMEGVQQSSVIAMGSHVVIPRVRSLAGWYYCDYLWKLSSVSIQTKPGDNRLRTLYIYNWI